MFEKAIQKAKDNGTKEIYINAINLNPYDISVLRKMIKSGELKPNEENLKRIFTDECVNKFMNGECIAPQLTYFIK